MPQEPCKVRFGSVRGAFPIHTCRQAQQLRIPVMAVPKSKKSKSRTRMRRAHDRLPMNTYIE
ncbi:MAG: 50S ribosomal protein L32, partial [Hyphomonas sp.]